MRVEPAVLTAALGLLVALGASACAPRATMDAPIVTQPQAGARVTSPLRVEGTAPGPWFFEAVFPAALVVDGRVVAEAPAQAQSDWMTEGRVPFLAELTFETSREQRAELVLTEDMPRHDAQGEELPLREIRIPLVLAPTHAEAGR